MFKDLLGHAYTLEIQPLDTVGALTDTLARRGALIPERHPTIKIRGQFQYKERLIRGDGGGATGQGAGSPALSGAEISTQAEVVITRRDAERAGYSPIRGDRLLCVIDRRGRADRVNLYVVRAKYQNELPGGFADWLLLLADRHPARAATN